MAHTRGQNKTARIPLAVIILDDDTVQVNMFRNVFNSHFPKQTLNLFFINDGDQAVRLISERPGQQTLLVTDIDHPGLNGVKLARLCREKFPEVTVLIQTAFAGDEQISEADAYADYVLLKPYRIQELVDIIEEILGKV